MNSTNISSYFFSVFLWFRRISVTLCSSSSCAALFYFASCCGVCLVHIEWSTLINHIFNQFFTRNHWNFEAQNLWEIIIFSLECQFLMRNWRSRKIVGCKSISKEKLFPKKHVLRIRIWQLSTDWPICDAWH